jgi:hypothetical protein
MFRYRMVQVSEAASLIGSLLILVAFQATSTGFLVYAKGKYGESAMCVGDPPKAMIAMGPQGELLMGVRGLDDACSQAKHFAVVNTDSPRSAGLGVILVVIGSFLRILLMERPISVREERKRLRKLRAFAA